MIYADTSVIAAYYCPEPLSVKAERLLVAEAAPAISWLTEVELASAVARKVREGELSSSDGGLILARFRLHVSSSLYSMTALDAVHYETARTWLGRCAVVLRSLDALHLAVAFSIGATVVTADRGQKKAADALGLPARLLA